MGEEERVIVEKKHALIAIGIKPENMERFKHEIKVVNVREFKDINL